MREFLAAREVYELDDAPSSLAAAEALRRRVAAVPRAPLAWRARVEREVLLARLERSLDRRVAKLLGKTSPLVPARGPRPQSAQDQLLAAVVERQARLLDLLREDDLIVAMEDAEDLSKRLPQQGRLRAAVAALVGRIDGRRAAISRGASAPATPFERDHLARVRIELGWPGSIAELAAVAEAEVARTTSELERVSQAAAGKSAHELTEGLKDGPRGRGGSLPMAKDEVARAAAFVKAKGLFTVDDAEKTLVVERGDPKAKTPFGHYLGPGTNGKPHGTFVVTPLEGDAGHEIGRRRDAYPLFIRGVAAHEGIPGHHLHFVRGRASGSELLKLGYDPQTTEGWGLFVEGVLERAGYFDDPPEARTTPLRMRRWRALRLAIDLGLHARTLDRVQAVQRLVGEGDFTPAVAEDEISRYLDHPGYYAGYLTGALRFERLEAKARARGGEAAARALRDEASRLGPACPLEAVERLLDR